MPLTSPKGLASRRKLDGSYFKIYMLFWIVTIYVKKTHKREGDKINIENHL